MRAPTRFGVFARSARQLFVVRHRDDAGSIALELAILAPALIGLISLTIGFGRYNSVTGNIESITQDAARAATQTRSYDDAMAAATQIVDDGRSRVPSSCQSTLKLDSITPAQFARGAMVTVTVSCTVKFDDLAIPGAPGSTTIARSFTSPLDLYNGVVG